jgi:hypothetical protein
MNCGPESGRIGNNIIFEWNRQINDAHAYLLLFEHDLLPKTGFHFSGSCSRSAVHAIVSLLDQFGILPP